MIVRPTPTGVLVYEGAPHTPEWFETRRGGITATDLPMILGLIKYGNALSVWRDKRGEREDNAGEAAKWGTKQEPIIADVWAEDHDTSVQPVGIIANERRPWMMASLDRLVDGCPDGTDSVCGLEIKTRNAYVAGKWRDEVPDDVLAQVQWGLMVTGLPHMHVACLIGGQKLQTYTVARDNKLEEYLLKAALPVWNRVQQGIAPMVDADSDGVLLRELNKMFADREGAVVVDPAEAAKQIETYARGHHFETTGKDIKTVAKGNMVKMLGGAEMATDADGNPLWTYKRGEESYTMTAGNLRRLQASQPDLYKEMVALGYITKASNNPKFLLK